jgi:hypothetical protein
MPDYNASGQPSSVKAKQQRCCGAGYPHDYAATGSQCGVLSTSVLDGALMKKMKTRQ